MNQSTISQEQVIENLSNKNNWVRLIYMLIYGLALHIAGIIMWLLCTVQFVITMIFGQDNDNLRKMAATISDYIHQALAFVSYNSEEKPFPFAKDKASNTQNHAATATDASASDSSSDSTEPCAAKRDQAQAVNPQPEKDGPLTIDVEAQAVEDGATDLPDEQKSDK